MSINIKITSSHISTSFSQTRRDVDPSDVFSDLNSVRICSVRVGKILETHRTLEIDIMISMTLCDAKSRVGQFMHVAKCKQDAGAC